MSLACSLSRADVAFHVDVNVGDPFTPAPQRVAIPKLLGWRDFGDLYVLSRRNDIVGAEPATALAAVASHREIELRPFTLVRAGYAELAQTRYQAWRRKNRREELPEHFEDLLTQVIALADPAISGGAAQLTWRASRGAWG